MATIRYSRRLRPLFRLEHVLGKRKNRRRLVELALWMPTPEGAARMKLLAEAFASTPLKVDIRKATDEVCFLWQDGL